MAKADKPTQIPFDQWGNVPHYIAPASYESRCAHYTWKDPYLFETSIEVIDSFHGRSSVYAVVRDAQGHKYALSFMDIILMLKDRDVVFVGNKVQGRFGFVKRGSNFFLAYLGAPTCAAS